MCGGECTVSRGDEIWTVTEQGRTVFEANTEETDARLPNANQKRFRKC